MRVKQKTFASRCKCFLGSVSCFGLTMGLRIYQAGIGLTMGLRIYQAVIGLTMSVRIYLVVGLTMSVRIYLVIGLTMSVRIYLVIGLTMSVRIHLEIGHKWRQLLSSQVASQGQLPSTIAFPKEIVFCVTGKVVMLWTRGYRKQISWGCWPQV